MLMLIFGLLLLHIFHLQPTDLTAETQKENLLTLQLPQVALKRFKDFVFAKSFAAKFQPSGERTDALQFRRKL